MRKNSIKNTRINGEVQRALAEIIRGDLKDPRIGEVTSVVAVEVAPDLKTCKVWVSVLGDEQAQADTLAGLNSAAGAENKSPQYAADSFHYGPVHCVRREYVKAD